MNALSPIESALGRFEATSPERLATASLQDRGDTKFVLASDRLEAVLEAVREHTTVVETDGRRSFSYRTVYFDTDDRRCYVDHQREYVLATRCESENTRIETWPSWRSKNGGLDR